MLMEHFELINTMNKRKGSFTVEAALIMPVILGVIVLFIYVAMYCYDRCVIEYVCQSVCADAAFDESIAADVEGSVNEKLSRMLAGNWDTKISTDRDETFVYVTIEAGAPLFERTFVHRARECGIIPLWLK